MELNEVLSLSTKKQNKFIKYLLKNKNSAYTTKEIALAVFGNDDIKTIKKTYSILLRINKRGLIKKTKIAGQGNYWILWKK